MLPWQPIKFSDLDKIHMNHRGLLTKHFCRKKILISAVRQQKLPLSTFPIISQWKQVAIATEFLSDWNKKHNYSFPPPIDAICEIWKESASEEKSFENVDRRTDDERTTDGCLSII